MNKSLFIAVVLALLFIGNVTAASFIESLPLWCANPSGAGNWIVQPLCK